VTDHSLPDDALREAFRSRAEASAASVSDEDRERVWLAVTGELDAPARRAIVGRMATDPALAEAWRVALELWSAAHEGAAATSAPASDSRMWPVWRIAAAAVVVLALAGTFVVLRDRATGDVVRDRPSVTIESQLAAGALLPRDDFRLRWTPALEGSRYDARVTTEDLRLITTAAELTTAELVVAPALLAGLPPGTRVLWQVDAILPDGSRISSATFVATLR
jgi:hypothetical protein